jgi:Putative prokaryotic signal transducing protein
VDETAVVKVVADEGEAQIACGLLETAGIDCGYRDTEDIDSSLENFTATGPREVFVHPSDLEAARAILEEEPGSP